jgi:hypothetical protein
VFASNTNLAAFASPGKDTSTQHIADAEHHSSKGEFGSLPARVNTIAEVISRDD